MNEATPTAELERLRAAGLSPTLLQHAGSGQPFLGFISYRRGDALPLARWLRDRITGFKAPVELKDKIAAHDASVGGSQNRVFLDLSYQKPNVDFWDEHIAASLCRSRTLLLLQTPSVFEKLPDGEPNWCEREIETFLKFYGDPSRVLVVMGPGAPIDRFPAPLERISARWDWVDLRFFSQSPLYAVPLCRAVRSASREGARQDIRYRGRRSADLESRICARARQGSAQSRGGGRRRDYRPLRADHLGLVRARPCGGGGTGRNSAARRSGAAAQRRAGVAIALSRQNGRRTGYRRNGARRHRALASGLARSRRRARPASGV